MKSASIFLGVLLLVSTVTGATAEEPQPPAEENYAELTARLESVRDALGIPGMAAALVKDQELVWAQGFGFADLDDEVEATPHTPFGLASVTKPVAATLIMQLVEEGQIDLDLPIAEYGVDAPGGSAVTVRHLLTHTSEGTPGETHSYNGNRYALLGGVIEGATGRTYADLTGDRFLTPLGMKDTALNPIDNWDDGSSAGFEDFRRSLGWGDSFDHYPDVYRRLAAPYQFDSNYETVAGMYHFTHSPAAGMVSSVSDLAAFDIALDRGELLSEAAMAEMFAPVVATVPGRSDVAYGLGWYVQEWAGHRMIWHTGRWPPSTSALYLKLPDEGLTFIVLANTDNMTVPFPGIGSGDLSRSTLMLTFFEQIVFDVPTIDWTADKATLVDQLSLVEDEETSLFLELELWSWRQAMASAGDHEQAAVLVDVNRTAFPGSPLRLDETYTYTAPAMPYIAPAVSASSLVTLAYLFMAWLVLVALSLFAMIYLLLRPVRAPATAWFQMMPATLVLGPVAVVAVLLSRNVEETGQPGWLHRGVVAAVLSMTAYALAWGLAVAILVGSGENPNPLVTICAIAVLPFLAGLFLVRVPSLRRETGFGVGKAAKKAAFPELMTAILGIGVLFAMTVLFDNRVLTMIPHPTSPYFWGMSSLAGMVGVVLLTVHYLLVQRRGMHLIPALSANEGSPDAGALGLPRFGDSWWVLLGSLVVAVACIALVA